MKKLTLFLLSFILCLGLFGQEKLTFKQVDTTTYIAWTNQEWEKIINIGNKAISDSIDYYYLRMRIGIAYYESKQFEEAIPHFEKALEFNSADEIAIEYVYYSLLFSGKVREAGFYAKSLPKSLTDKIKPSVPKKVDRIGISTSINFYPDFETHQKDITGPEAINYRLEKDLSGPFKSIGLSLNHEFSEKTNLFYDFHLLESTNFQQLYYNGIVKHQSEYKLRQYQFYICPTFYWKNNRTFSPFVHLLYLQAENFKYEYMNVVLIPQVPPPAIPSYIYRPVKENTISSVQFIAGYNFSKNLKRSVFDYSFSISKLNNILQLELTPGYTFYFNAKKSFFSHTTLSVHFQRSEINLILNQSMGIRVFPNTWFELFGSYGNMNNYNENNGYSVYNTSDITSSSLGAKLSFPIFKKISFYLSYTLSEKENIFEFKRFTGFNNKNVAIYKTDIKKITYQQQLIYGGLLWKF